MTIRMYKVGDSWWHGVEIDGKIVLISYIGKVGDCIRP